MEISLDIIHEDEQQIVKFIELSKLWVDEIDNNNIDREIQDIRRRMNYVDHCIIKLNESVVGVARITYSSIFSFGVTPDLDDFAIKKIFNYLLNDIFYLKPPEVRATLSTRFRKIFEEVGFKYQFGREKMILHLADPLGLKHISEIETEKLDWKAFDAITDMFVDAYRNTVDETIGMFNEDIAFSAIQQVKEGEYGKIIRDLSIFIRSEGKLIGGVITSENENQLFIVIIGVKREYQGRGIGRILLTRVIEEGKKMGYSNLSLWVTTENIQARSLYQSMNFKVVSRVISGKLRFTDYKP